MVRSAHPKRHRLEACATNIFLSKRGACSCLFHRKQKTDYLMQDTIIKEITAIVRPRAMVFTVHKGGALPSRLPFETLNFEL